jgi:hypothetical protein
MCIKFCIKLGKNSAETFEMLKSNSDDECLNCSHTFERFTSFKECCTSDDDDDPQSRQLSPCRNDDSVKFV